MGNEASRMSAADQSFEDMAVARDAASTMDPVFYPAPRHAGTPIVYKPWRPRPAQRPQTAEELIDELANDRLRSYLSLPVPDIVQLLKEYSRVRMRTWYALPPEGEPYDGEVLVGAVPQNWDHRYCEELLLEQLLNVEPGSVARKHRGKRCYGVVTTVTRPRIVLPDGEAVLTYTVDLWRPDCPLVCRRWADSEGRGGPDLYMDHMMALGDVGKAALSQPSNVKTAAISNLPPRMLELMANCRPHMNNRSWGGHAGGNSIRYRTIRMGQQHMFRTGALEPQHVLLQLREDNHGYRVMVFDARGTFCNQAVVNTDHEADTHLKVRIDDAELCVDAQGRIVVAEYCSDHDEVYDCGVLIVRVRRFS